MVISEHARLLQLAVHYTGNKQNQEGIKLSQSTLKTDALIKDILLKYFISPFKGNEYHNFYHETDLKFNEVFNYVTAIFEDKETFFDQSVNLVKHLYEQSDHPKIKSGEFYIAYFKDCNVDGEVLDAVGLFKSESRETYLKVYESGHNFQISSEDGININKLDKGCLVFNTEKEKGYLVAVIDAAGKGTEAQYWMDDFLHLQSRNDDFYQTKNVLQLCKSFVMDKLPEEFDISRADQADLLNKSAKFFKEKKDFDLNNFTEEVIQNKEIIDSFNDYRNKYSTDNNIIFDDSFDISGSAVKKQAKNFKSVIKLDGNFHIYIHGNRKYIDRGYDEETGMHYYKLLFKEEA